MPDHILKVSGNLRSGRYLFGTICKIAFFAILKNIKQSFKGHKSRVARYTLFLLYKMCKEALHPTVDMTKVIGIAVMGVGVALFG